jgi:hypothetical protein
MLSVIQPRAILTNAGRQDLTVLTGMKFGNPSGMLSFDISAFSLFRWFGFLIPIAVRSSGVILESRFKTFFFFVTHLGACIIKLITAVIYGFLNKLECVSLNTRLCWKGLPGTNTYYGIRKLRPC